MSRLDVAIVGGGPVGLTLALALEQAGASVAVVDAAAPETALAANFDGRAFAIAFANFRMWRALGLGDALDPVVQPIARIMVTDGRPLGGVRKGGPSLLHLMFDAEEAGESLGYMVENRHLRKALDDRVRASGVRRIAPMGVTAFETGASGVTLTLADQSTLKASLLVGADGRRSFVRPRTGIRTIGWEYDATAIVATVRHEKPHEAVAHEFFLPSGPFAILPLKGERANIVWAEPRKVAAAIKALDAEDFRAELKRRFGDFLGDVWLEGPRFSYPLSMQIAERMIAPRVALAGDSAHAIHPIAGQGLNLGLKDAAALAECVGDALGLGLDAGDATALTRYQRWRRFDNVAMACAMEFFDRLFSNDVAPVRSARRLGLEIVNRIGPARRFFMRQAGGAGGAMPKLLRGEGLGL
ncbi:MAG: FAD-dependent monooxygenase [Hyphomonadaceae bacterium]|nr:FAD-dependent monooxygenase [Hyphomonadaceae bacterium]